MSDAKSELQLIGTHGEPEPSGLFRLSYGTEPNDPVPFILTLTPQYVARAIGKTAPTDIRNYAEQNADKLKKRRLKKPEASPRTHLNSALGARPGEAAGVASNIAKLPELLRKALCGG